MILSVQEALSMIAPAYREITGTDAQLMEALIFSNLDKVITCISRWKMLYNLQFFLPLIA